MKTTIKIKRAVVTLLCVAAVAGLWSCSTDTVEENVGKLPDKDPLENTYVKIRSARSATGFAVANLTVGTTMASDRIYCQLTHSAEKAMTITASVDESLVAPCNEKFGTNLLPMPAANVTIAGNGRITVAQGERISDKIQISFKSDGLETGTYLLPVVIASDDATFTEDNRVIYYGIKVRGLELGDYELETDYMNVFYLNTTIYQPLLADLWMLQKQDAMPPFNTIWERVYGNIVNLRIVQLVCDPTTSRAMLNLGKDMSYVLLHADKYIRPLQDKGRKVCLCLEGGGSGLGFCNLNDAQIADFTAQVKTVIDEFKLDGVNFFDKNSGYGKDGMPAVNTTSYPKLIKAMREALGADKLVTLADYEEPTAYFNDTEKTEGIEVGKYIDYAWSGYMSEDEDLQLLDPCGTVNLTPEEAADLGMTLPISNHPRQPIAGLAPENYGYFAVPWYAVNSPYLFDALGFMNIAVWKALGLCPNKMIVWGDLIGNTQGAYESSWNMVPAMLWMVFPDGAFEGEYMYNLIFLGPTLGDFPYNYMKKDW
ncbi:MAG: DUF1735 domain-containing protein [Alistipes sp.]